MLSDRTAAIHVMNPPVASHADAYGLKCQAELDGWRMLVMLPNAPLSEQGPFSAGLDGLQPPGDMDARLRDFMASKLRQPLSPWGYVARIDTGAGWVRRIVVELDGHIPRRPASSALGAWEGRMLMWLEVWTSQNLSRPARKDGLMPAMGVMHLHGDGVLRPKAMLAQEFTESLHHLDMAANRADWEKAIKLAAQKLEPPLQYCLLRDAEVQLGRGEQRLAVITAGTAVEIAVTQHLRTHGPDPGDNPSLGQVLGIARDRRLLDVLHVHFDRDIDPTLLKLRNDATHRAYKPTTAETTAALDVATTLVQHFAPLEGYRARP